MVEEQANIDIRRNLGARIRMLREERGLSQYAFAEMVSIDRSYLIGVEKGRRNLTVNNLAKISRGLGISLSDLFENVDSSV
jgi:transcriptional regulator with XRE-family HTH domain